MDSSTQAGDSRLQTRTCKETQDLVDEAHLKGWRKGFEDGNAAGYREGYDAGERYGVTHGRFDDDDDEQSFVESGTQTDDRTTIRTDTYTQSSPPAVPICSSIITILTATPVSSFTQNARKRAFSFPTAPGYLNSPITTPERSHSCPTSPYNSTLSKRATAVASALETRSKMVNFAPKHQKPENSPISTQTFFKTASPSIVGPTDDVTQAYANPETPNVIILQPPALTPTASSSPTPLSPHPTKHEKCALPPAIFESQPHTESPVPSTIIPAIKTRSESANSMTNCQNIENTHNFDQKTPEYIVSTRFNWADNAAELPTLSTGPTKSPRDLSSLRSPTSPKNPFSSLQRRRQKFNKNRTHFNYSRPQYHCHHTFPGPYSHSQNLHHHSQPPFSASLNWDRDPRLLDLSNALKALGWV